MTKVFSEASINGGLVQCGALVSKYVVTLRWAQLELGWATICGTKSHS